LWPVIILAILARMKTSHRNYSEAAGDFNRLAHFVIDHNSLIRTHSTWCIGRLVDWKYGIYENKTAFAAFCDENAHLWFDDFDRLAGFAISENGDSGFAIITLPGYRFLFEEILNWVLNAWASRGPHFAIEITEQQTSEAIVLARHGFHQTATFFTRHFDLTGDRVERYPLEPGFTIVDMRAHPDWRAQRILRDNAFKGKTTVTDEEMAWELRMYNHSHNGPLYHPDTDLCVMAPDGRFVAGCEALIDAANCEADIERVCTHSDFRRRGFSRAVIRECLHRLQDMGMVKAYITGYSPEAVALYGSLGAESESRAFIFEKVVD